MKRRFYIVFFIALFGASDAFGFDYFVNGIYYSLLGGDSVQVTYSVKGDNNSTAYTGSVTIPSTVRLGGVWRRVVWVSDSAFYKCSGLTSISMPNSVTRVGQDAFRDCTGLNSVSFSDSLTVLDNGSFYGCTTLPSVTLPSTLKRIGSSSFRNCDAIQSVTIPNDVKVIESYVFYDCDDLATINLPNTLTRIEKYAFYDCDDLSFPSLPDSLKYIGAYAFYYCFYWSNTTHHSIVLPDHLDTIGDHAFEYCHYLNSVFLPNSVRFVGNQAFYNCGYYSAGTLQPIYNDKIFAYLPRFSYTSDNYGSYTIPSGITTIASGAFYSYSPLTSITIPNSVKRINSNAFNGCYNLATINMSDSVQFIGDSAFISCSDLTIISLPKTLKSIGYRAFYGSSTLNRIELHSSTPPSFGTQCFNSVPGNFFVPCDSLVPYQTELAKVSVVPSRVFGNPYSISVTSANQQQGTVTILDQPYTCPDSIAIFQAYPNAGSTFLRWSDGNTVNPRTIRLTADTTLQAIFQYNSYTVSASAVGGGSVSGGGTFEFGTEIAIVATANDHYHFVRWNNGTTNPTLTHTVHNDTVIVAYFEIDKYVIVFANYDNSELQRDTLNYGTMPVYRGATPTRQSSGGVSYTFKCWSETIDTAVCNKRYIALYDSTVSRHRITFVNYDGSVLQTDTLNYGQTPAYRGTTPTKPATAHYTYTFKGWNPALEIVAKDTTYVAQYDSVVRQYTITFVNYNGATLQTKQVNYGATPTYTGTTPTKPFTAQYTYTFKGWNPAIAAVTGAATYTAQYDSTAVNLYLIRFVNYDGTVLQSSNLPLGATPSYTGTTPTKPSTAQYTYTFKGWYPAVAAVTGAATYTAQYDSTIIAYTITFVNYNGATLQSSQVNYGTTPQYTGATPTKPATAQYNYTFKGWYPAVTAVTGAATYTAQYDSTIIAYTITFVNYNGATLQSNQVNYGVTPQYTGATPTKPATAQYTYTFKGWYPAVIAVTGAATYTAQYDSTITAYTITFVNYNGATLQSTQVNYGATPQYTGATPSKPATAQYTYSFKGWYPAVTTVTGAATYTAQYDSVVNKYTVTVNYDATKGTVTGGGTYNYGASITLVATPNPGCQFAGWSDGETNPQRSVMVTGNMTFTAIFKSTQYQVSVNVNIDGRGTITGTGSYEYGESVTLTATPNEGYEFACWSNGVTSNAMTFVVVSDTVFTANFLTIETGVENTSEVNYIAYTQAKTIHLHGVSERAVTLYDISGKVVTHQENAPNELSFDVPISGVYLIKIDDGTILRVVVK